MRVADGSKRRVAILALSALGALWILSRAFTGVGIERIRRLPPDEHLLAVHEGQVLIERGREIVALPVRAGRARVLDRAPDSPGFRRSVTLDGSNLLVARGEPEKGEHRIVEAPGGRRSVTWIRRSPAQTRFVEVPLDGGPVHPLPLVVPTDRPVVIGRECFWIRGQPDRLEIVSHSDRSRTFRSIPRSELVVTPLEGGPTRVIASGVFQGTFLQARGGYLLWTGQGGSGGRVLCSYRPGDSGVTVLHRFSGSEVPEVHDGRFYWMVDRHPGSPVPGSPDPAGLISALPDGSERRVVIDMDTDPSLQQPARLLGPHRRSLYGIFVTPARSRSSGGTALVLMLCRILPGHPTPVEKLKELPVQTGTALLDGDYCYFEVLEHHEDWWDWSQNGLSGKDIRVLYRCRLPG